MTEDFHIFFIKMTSIIFELKQKRVHKVLEEVNDEIFDDHKDVTKYKWWVNVSTETTKTSKISTEIVLCAINSGPQKRQNAPGKRPKVGFSFERIGWH